MTDKQIIYDCPHISLTDWGTYACKLYNPRDKNCIVSGGNCKSNIICTYKLKAEIKELKEQLTILDDEDMVVEITAKQFEEYKKLEAEVKSKTEYIQEQRDIINQYSKEIEMYKKCQGKRASKREEELKAENEELKTGLKQIQEQFGIEILYCKTTGESTFRSTEILKLKKALNDIESLCYEQDLDEDFFACEVLQKISEVQDGSN